MSKNASATAAATAATAQYREILEGQGPGGAAGRVATGRPWDVSHRGADGRVKKLGVTPPVYDQLIQARSAAVQTARDALRALSVLEHRALVTGDPSDHRAYTERAVTTEAALVALWQLDVWAADATYASVLRGQRAAVDRLESAADRLRTLLADAEPTGEEDGELRQAVAGVRALHTELITVSNSPSDASLSLMRTPPAIGAPQQKRAAVVEYTVSMARVPLAAARAAVERVLTRAAQVAPEKSGV